MTSLRYDGTDWSYSTECDQSNGCVSNGYEKGTAPAAFHGGLTALGDYYGRLLAWCVMECSLRCKWPYFMLVRSTSRILRRSDARRHAAPQ
jgi:hypothetical protein